jgi:hypothetical protein
MVLSREDQSMQDHIRTAQASRDREIEAEIHRFRECGVEIERFSLQEYPDETLLCVDGVPRFSWSMTCNLPGWRS